MQLFLAARSVLFVLSLSVLAACGGGIDGGGVVNNGNAVRLGTLLTLNPAERQTMLFVREEEKLARDVYLTLYGQWGEPTFYNIATKAEQAHMDAVKAMLDALGIADPVVNDAVGVFADPAIQKLYNQLVARAGVSLNEALAVGAYIEEFDIIDVQQAKDGMIAGTNQAAILQTYDNLICGSRNHLRAFVGRIQALGSPYTAQLMTQAQVNAIVNSPSETCGR